MYHHMVGVVVSVLLVFLSWLGGQPVVASLRAGEPSVHWLLRRWAVEIPLQVRATPEVWEDMVYASLRSGEVVAVSLRDGSTVWRVGTSGIARGGVGLHGGNVVFGTDQGKVTCVDSVTGTPRWDQDVGDAVVCRPAFDGEKVYVAGQSGTVYALQLATGSVVWQARVGDLPGTSPVVADGRVYVVTAGSGTGRARVYAIQAATGNVALLAELEGWSGGCLQVQGDTVFTVTSSDRGGSVWAINAESGQILWRFQDPFNSRWGSLLLGDDTVYAGNQGRLVALDSATGELRWQWTGDAVTARIGRRRAVFYPNVIGISWDGDSELLVTVYWEATSSGELVALSTLDGRAKWKQSFGSRFASGILVHGRTVLVPLIDQLLVLGRPVLAVQGEQVKDPDVPVHISGQTMYAPLRPLAEAMGFEVSWDSSTRRARCVLGEFEAWVPVGACYIMVGGKQVDIGRPVLLVNNRVVVPVRAFVEAAGGVLFWDHLNLTADVVAARDIRGR